MNTIKEILYELSGFNHADDFKAIESLACAGNPEAQTMLGMLIQQGVQTDLNQDPVYWLEQAARQGLSEAQVFLGVMYSTDKANLKDSSAKAEYWLKQPFLTGNAFKDFSDHEYLLNKMRIFKSLAKAGSTTAQNIIGNAYAHGDVFTKDVEKAMFWLKKSASKGSSDALLYLGMIFNDGEYAERDYEKARYYYEEAASKGCCRSQLLLGGLYHLGSQELPVNIPLAIHWYSQVAGLAVSENKTYRAVIAMSQYRLGILYLQNIEFDSYHIKAHHWLSKSCANGNDSAYKILQDFKAKIL